MTYWLEYWWLLPIALAICVMVCLVGVVLAYRIPQPALLVIVAVALPALAWYLRRPAESPPRSQQEDRRPSEQEKVRAAATRIPLCCYASSNYYTQRLDSAPEPAPSPPAPDMREHRDRQGRRYRYAYRGRPDQFLVGSVGGLSTGLLGFGVGVLGVAHLVIRRIPIRIAVGTSHFVILLVTGAAVAAHLVEITAGGVAPPWNIVAVNAIAVLAGGQLAAWLAGRLPEHRTRAVLVTLLLALAAVTLYRGLRLLD